MKMVVRGMKQLLNNLSQLIKGPLTPAGTTSRKSAVVASGSYSTLGSPVAVTLHSTRSGVNRVTVGYDPSYVEGGGSAYYAVYVHEDPRKYHKPPTRYKFLEEPAKLLQTEIGLIIKGTMQGGGSLQDGLVNAAQYLLVESQKIVPEDTGRLKRSGFVRVG